MLQIFKVIWKSWVYLLCVVDVIFMSLVDVNMWISYFLLLLKSSDIYWPLPICQTSYQPLEINSWLGHSVCAHGADAQTGKRERQLSNFSPMNNWNFLARGRHTCYRIPSNSFFRVLSRGHDIYLLTTGLYIICSFCLKGMCTNITIDINDINVSFICCYTSVPTLCQIDPY